MPFDPATQELIERAVAALSHPQQQQPTAAGAPTLFQETAADRATRLWRQAGPDFEMENDSQYRTNMLGHDMRWPTHNLYGLTAEGPTSDPSEVMRHLRNARSISEGTSHARMQSAPKGPEQLKENARKLRASNTKRGL